MISFRTSFIALMAVSLTLALSGCGGGNSADSTGGGTTTTVTSVTVSPNPATVTAGNNLSFTATVQGQNNPSQVVSWSVPANAGTITSGGAFIASSAITTPTTATITAASTVPGYMNVTGSATVTINPVLAPTVTITASPSPITLGASTVVTWSSTNASSCNASGGWSGTQATSGSITETPTATGSITYTLGCNGTGGSGSASVTVTVNPVPLPNVTSFSQSTIFTDWADVNIYGVVLTGTNFASTDTVYPSGFNNLFTSSYGSSTTFNLELQFGSADYSPGLLTFAVCENTNDTNCGTPQSIAFLGAQNYLATSSSGEFFSLDQAQGLPGGQNGYVRKYTSNGTADGSFFVGAPFHSIAVDNKTGNVLVDAYDYDENGGSTDVAIATNLPSGTVGAVAAENGYGCFTLPSGNNVSCYPLTGPAGGTPVHTAPNLGITPWAIAMGTFGSETDAFVVSVGDTPAPLLHKLRASDAYAGEEPALALIGISPLSTVVSASLVAGGLQVAVFDSGSPSGTVAVLSTYDQLLLLVNNASPWAITKSVKLSGVPFRIVADKANGRVLVAYANPTSVTTTYAWVDVSTGVVTPLTATSSLLSVGLGCNGTNIISAQRNQLELKAAQ